jgi:exonuclease III
MLGACIRQVHLTAAARELARHETDLVGVQEVRWDKGGTVRAGEYNFFYGKGKENYQMGIGLFVQHRIVPAVKRVEYVSDRVPYIVLKGRCCNMTVLNVHAPSDEKVMIQKTVLREIRAGFRTFP